MIALRPDDHDALQRLARAGADGLPLGEIPVSSAIMLALADLITITTPPEPQRAFITRAGRAFSLRDAYA